MGGALYMMFVHPVCLRDICIEAIYFHDMNYRFHVIT